MDIKAEVEKIVAKATKDGDFKDKLMKDPAGTIKGLVGDKVDKETMDKIVETVKGAIGKGSIAEIGDTVKGALGGLLGMCVFHHKTRKFYFWLVNLLGLAWQIAALWYIGTKL